MGRCLAAGGADTAFFRRGRAGNLRAGHQHQHLCPVLCLQRRAGGAADHLHELWCTSGGAHPRRAPAGAGVVRGVLRFLDGAEPCLAEPLYPHLHAATAAILTMAPGIVRTYAVSFLLLPAVLGPASIWWAMPVTELLVACYAAAAMRRATRALPSC